MVPAEGLADEVTADVRLGLLSATCARELGRLPRGNQPKVAQVIARRGLTTRQTTRLIDQLVAAADDRAHAVVLANAERTSPPVVTTARCKYDGQKTVVLRWEGPQPIYNPRFIAFATYYLFRQVGTDAVGTRTRMRNRERRPCLSH